eukprot:jgi/Mesvir1/13936/Mv02942-RA.1
MIFQHFNLMKSRTVFENIAYPLRGSGLSKEEIRGKVLSLLKLVELEDKESAYPSQLSGGQKQRVGIARALANDPKVLLCDEATSALDPQTTKSILRLLKEVNKKLNLTIVVITHEMQVVKEICTRVAVMEKGRIVEEGNIFKVFSEPKQEITRNFIESTSILSNINYLIEDKSSVVEIREDEKILKLKYLENSTTEPIISIISREFNVDANIIFGNVEIIEDAPLGGLIVIIRGEEEKVRNVIKYLEENNVEVEGNSRNSNWNKRINDSTNIRNSTILYYSQPNQALADGEIDLNAFQHYAYLNQDISDRGFDLSVIGETIIAPLGIYSKKISSVNEIPAGGKIAIPSDATNGGRALKLLEAAGLIKVDEAAGYTPNLDDITENPKKIEIIEVEAAQTPRLLEDVDASVINGGHAVDAGFIPKNDAIYLEEVKEGSDNPYINVIVARTEDKDNEIYKKIVEAYRTDEVANIIEEERYFHQHPEESLKEYNTANKIEEELDKLNIPYQRIGETGVLGIIKGKKPSNRVLAIRADIDALKVPDNKDEGYKSINKGYNHACGHDGHIASLLGAAKILKGREEDLAGEVRLFFQQAEEIGQGARIFVKEGCLEGVEEILGAMYHLK